MLRSLRIGQSFATAKRVVVSYHAFNNSSRAARLVGLAAGAVVCSYTARARIHCDAGILSGPHEVTAPALPFYEAEIVAPPSTQAGRIMHNIKRSIRYLWRLLQYAVYGIPALSLVPIGYYFPSTEEAVWTYLVWTIEQLGPTFIKFAQWASSRPDIFPVALVRRLKRLQDDVRVTHSMVVVENTLADAFGENWRDQLILDPKPIGAGCVAQVFRGTLKTQGKTQKVAVKLIHPQVESIIKVDMELLGYLADILDKNPTLEILSIGDTCRQFAEMMREQLDLRVEASHLKKFIQNFKQENWLIFPDPIDQYVRRNILVETFMDGEPLTKLMEAPITPKVKKTKEKLADLGTRAILKMLFFDNFIHGDLHPGIFFSEYFLDVGETTDLSVARERDGTVAAQRRTAFRVSRLRPSFQGQNKSRARRSI
jgi:predicted unusual protein kinase regulating ubiquinone biosynthesis (AarF/ABC1/UbiB family)